MPTVSAPGPGTPADCCLSGVLVDPTSRCRGTGYGLAVTDAGRPWDFIPMLRTPPSTKTAPGQRGPLAFTRYDLGGDHPPRSPNRSDSFPVRRVAPTTTPNQRPRISQPSVPMLTPVSSARHSCHRSSRCTMPATATTWGRAPASRRAAITIPARAGTLTTTAWTHLTPGHHRVRRLSSAPWATLKRATTVAAAAHPPPPARSGF
jgi:hypothetical protein